MLRKKEFVFIVIIILTFFMLIELVGRSIDYFAKEYNWASNTWPQILNHKEPMLGYANRRNISETLSGWTIKTNSLGFRYQRDVFPQKDEGIFRIFLLGGSTAFGWGVNDNETISYYLEEILNNKIKTRRFECVNAGVGYYASWNELAMLAFRVLDLKPDLVIVFDGRNDLYYGSLPSWQPVFTGYADEGTMIALSLKNKPIDISNVLNYFLRNSVVFRYLQDRIMIKKLKLSAGIERAKFNEIAAKQYVAIISRMAAISKGEGIPILFLFQPIMYLDKNFLTEREKNNWGMADGHKSYVEFMQRMYPLFEEGLLLLNKFQGIESFSLRSIFQDFKEDAYLDEAHYTAKGDKLIAEKIFEYVNKYCE